MTGGDASDVFLSYARQDRPTAQFMAQALERCGYSVWWDRDLLGGQDFEREIGRELAAARVVVVLWSAASVRSDWVRDEAATARDRGVLVPVQLDDTSPPMGFRSLHTIPFDPADPVGLLRAIVRLTTGDGDAATVPSLVRERTGLGLVELALLLALFLAVGVFVALLVLRHA